MLPLLFVAPIADKYIAKNEGGVRGSKGALALMVRRRATKRASAV